MRRPLPSAGLLNTLSFVRDVILSSSGDGGHMQKMGSWRDVLRLTHSVGLTLLGAGTIGALLLLRQVSPGAALSWILQARSPHVGPDPSSVDPSQLSIPGLRNVGNNCFLNAILQALASSGVLLSFFAAYDRATILSLFHGVESRCPSLPLTEALSYLLVELSELDSEPRVASPRHVMHALEPYAKQFDLSLQQDAAEALTYLTSALHEERLAFFETFRAYRESISDASRACIGGGLASGMVIENLSRKESSPLNSWKHQLRWPMEGTMGSMLTCQECGFQVHQFQMFARLLSCYCHRFSTHNWFLTGNFVMQFSTQFQSFHDVPLSPLQLPDGNIVSGCNLEACLEQFTAPECITNVSCSYCSHSLALRLLQGRDGFDKDLLQRIKDCTCDDDCLCEKFVMQAGGLWRNVYVNALKQLRFGCCPEVMCCQMQRAIVNRSGELVKWTGHVSFPLVLNLFPYVMSAQGYSLEMSRSVGKSSVQSMGHNEVLQQFLWPKRPFEMQSNAEFHISRVPTSTDGSSSDDTNLSGSEDLASDTSSESISGRLGDDVVQHKHKEGFELHRCNDGGINPGGYGDLKMYGLDSALFSRLGHSLKPLDDREQLLLKFQELGDSASFFEPCSQMEPMHNPFVNSPRPQNSLRKSSIAIASASVQNKNRDLYELPQDGLCNSERWLYELISVVVHHGSPRNGHYTVYRKAKLKNNHNTEKEQKSDMPEDDATDAMNLDESSSGGIDEETNDNKYAIADSPVESSSTTILNGPMCETQDSNGGEINDVIGEALAGSRGELLARQVICDDSSKRVMSGLDKDLEVKEDACFQAPGNSTSMQLLKEEIVLWFRVSDSHVDLVTEEEVLMAQATLLFYERSVARG